MFTIKHIYINKLDGETLALLKSIHQQNQKIMSELKDIRAEFANLETAIAEERAQATAKLDELNGKVDELTANIQAGGTAEERDALLADIKSQVLEVKAIIPDPANPPAEEPTEEPQA